MSFVERNKTWLLPLLAAGVVAVFWFDFRSTDAPATTPSVATPAQTVAPEAAASLSGGPPSPSAQDSGSALPPLGPDAWGDLRPLNGAPGFQNQSNTLTTQATRPLTADQLDPQTSPVVGAQIMATPNLLMLPSPTNAGLASEPPPLEFISRTPAGLRAWYQGVAFKSGQTILGTPYRIREIAPPRVVLDGPTGRIEQATFRLAPPSETPHQMEPP